jgi:hypothetical protein
MESLKRSVAASGGKARIAVARLIARAAFSAQSAHARQSLSGSTSQLVFMVAARCAIGFASNPMTLSPSFLPSTKVVPVPQNGSSRVCPGLRPNSAR